MIVGSPQTIRSRCLLRKPRTFLFLVGLLSLILASCATVEEQMAGYVGQHKSELINNWGPPAEEKKLKNGGSRLVYRETNPLIHPNQYMDPASNVCEKVFTTDSRGIIKSYKHDNCQ